MDDSVARPAALNEHQQTHLIVSCQYVNRLLGDCERAFLESDSTSPFSRYVADLAPAERRVVQAYIARIRTQLVRILASQGLSPAPLRVGLRRSTLTHFGYIDVAIEELTPKHMRGYGEVPSDAAATLNGVVEELRATTAQISRYLSSGAAGDLRARLERIGESADVLMLHAIEDIIRKHGLIEFRSALATILDTLERRGLELAVFGRVSTGKSSLLNRLLGHDVLPVGVTPITAVPTRIRYGDDPRLRVWFANAAPRELAISALTEFASEHQNPANVKRVVHLIAEVPAPFLESGVTLVDTPGLGSLATAGAAETLAYLPRCDVAAVLIDAGSTIMAEDLKTIALLIEAGIRVFVLVSKADLVSPKDLDASMAYVREVLLREFRMAIPIAAVSVVPAFEHLFEHWCEAELDPLIAHQERERQATAARKTEILRLQVEAALRQRGASRQSGVTQPVSAGANHDRAAADATLRAAASNIAVAERRLSNVDLRLPLAMHAIMARTAELVDQGHHPRAALDEVFRGVAREAADAVTGELEDLVRSLRVASRQVAADVHWADEGADALDDDIAFVEVPVPSLPADLRLPTKGIERVLGHAFARAIILNRIEHAVGDIVKATLDGYGSVLRRWALDTLGDIRAEWASTTDALRAHLDRVHGHEQGGVPATDGIEADLQRLSAPPPDERCACRTVS